MKEQNLIDFLAEFWELALQEFECWRMFGWLVELEFGDCVYMCDVNTAARNKK